LAFYIWGAHWRHLKNTTEPSMCGGDAALCQITLITCCNRDRPRGTPPPEELNTRGVVKYSGFGHIEGYISETVQDRRYVCINH